MSPSSIRVLSSLASLYLFAIATCLGGVGSAEVSSAVKRSVEVIYAIVPRTSLSEAVKSPASAQSAEARFLDANAGAPSARDLSVVVFVKNTSKVSPLFGRLRVFIPDPIEIEVFSMSDRAYSIFVVDTGGVSYVLADRARRHEWITLKARL